MLVQAKDIAELRRHTRLVGFWGAVPRELLLDTADRLGAELVDLDIYYGAPSSGLVPEAYCHIIRNCVDNARALHSRLCSIVAATGKEKCDAGRYAAWLVHRSLGIEVIEADNTALPTPSRPLLAEAFGPLKKRVVRIMRSIVRPLGDDEKAQATAVQCEPTHGFWGTPPHPIELLDLFPPTTHLYGWTRCVEQGRPADLELETAVPDDLPIIFFSQGFCQKAQIARRLAEEKRGMHVDVHDAVNAAMQAKIEAFIRLSAPRGVK